MRRDDNNNNRWTHLVARQLWTEGIFSTASSFFQLSVYKFSVEQDKKEKQIELFANRSVRAPPKRQECVDMFTRNLHKLSLNLAAKTKEVIETTLTHFGEQLFPCFVNSLVPCLFAWFALYFVVVVSYFYKKSQKFHWNLAHRNASTNSVCEIIICLKRNIYN